MSGWRKEWRVVEGLWVGAVVEEELEGRRRHCDYVQCWEGTRRTFC